MDKNICAPNKYDNKNNTCFSLEQLLEMAKAYNRYITKIKLSPEEKQYIKVDTIKIKEDKQYLLKELLKKFDKICKGNEFCLSKQEFMNEVVKEMREEIDQHTFRPSGPPNPTEWISTIDINNILIQYEQVYSDFKFLGAVPLNCDELQFCSLYKLDFGKYDKMGVTRFGIIFNYDKFGQAGSHWVTAVANTETGEIYFCDSMGKKPFGNIVKFIEQFRKYYENETGEKIIYKYNTKKYQTDSSECGIYSINFIIRLLSGESYEDIIDDSLDFQGINSCRSVYFRNKPSKFKPHPKCDPDTDSANKKI